jgi:hypothetical protein
MYLTRKNGGGLTLGCLNSLAVYKSALGRLTGEKFGEKVKVIIGRLAENDPTRKGRYKEWEMAIENS